MNEANGTDGEREREDMTWNIGLDSKTRMLQLCSMYRNHLTTDITFSRPTILVTGQQWKHSERQENDAYSSVQC